MYRVVFLTALPLKRRITKNSECPDCPSPKILGVRLYLGDIISSDTKIDENIKMRHEKGLGIINQILSILKEISFGMYYFEIGLLFRVTMLVNEYYLTQKLFLIFSKSTLIFWKTVIKYSCGSYLTLFTVRR